MKTQKLTPEILAEAKRMEFPDSVIAKYVGITEADVRKMRLENGIVAAFKMVDTCAAEFEASTPYYYSVFGSQSEVEENHDKKKVIRFRSDPYRTGY